MALTITAEQVAKATSYAVAGGFLLSKLTMPAPVEMANRRQQT